MATKLHTSRTQRSSVCGTFRCKVCSKEFTGKKSLKKHAIIHSKTKSQLGYGFKKDKAVGDIGKKSYPCEFCINQTFPDESTLSRHYKIHIDKIFKCKFCDKSFALKRRMKRHIRSHKENHIYRCEFCDKVCMHITEFEIHQLEHSDEVQGKFCDKTFAKEQSHSQEKCRLCKVCHKSFPDKRALKKHKKVHKDTSIKCEFCSKSFKLQSHLKLHYRKHISEKTFDGKECPETLEIPRDSKWRNKHDFPSERLAECVFCAKKCAKSQLKEHLLTHEPQKKHSCSTCGKKFMQKSHLNRHLACHENTRTYKCELCAKSFYRKDYLVCHAKTHQEITALSCSTCKRVFSQENQYRAHMGYCVKIKTFHCKKCEKIFSRRGQLKQHLLFHNKDRNFECAECSSCFHTAGNLRRHEMTHKGLSLYKCVFCDKSFTQKGTLTIHLRIHTKEKPYECNTCHAKFISRGQLNSHVRVHFKVTEK